MKQERVVEYARMLLGPVRFADKETRAQTVHILKNMLDEEYRCIPKETRESARLYARSDAALIDASQRFNAVTLAKAGYLAPWKKKLCKALGL